MRYNTAREREARRQATAVCAYLWRADAWGAALGSQDSRRRLVRGRRHEYVETATGPRVRARALAASLSHRWSLHPHKHAPKLCTTGALRMRMSARRLLSRACTVAVHKLISVARLSSSAFMLTQKTSMADLSISSLTCSPACGKRSCTPALTQGGDIQVHGKTRKRSISAARACSIRASTRASRSLGAVIIWSMLQRQLAPC